MPQELGCGALAVMSEGIEFRGKNHTAMPVSSHFTTRDQLGSLRGNKVLTSIHASSVVVERRSEGVGLAGTNTATSVASVSSSTVSATNEGAAYSKCGWVRAR